MKTIVSFDTFGLKFHATLQNICLWLNLNLDVAGHETQEEMFTLCLIGVGQHILGNLQAVKKPLPPHNFLVGYYKEEYDNPQSFLMLLTFHVTIFGLVFPLPQIFCFGGQVPNVL